MHENIKGIIMKFAEHLQLSLNQTGTTVSYNRLGLAHEPNCIAYAVIQYFSFILIQYFFFFLFL